MKRLRGIAALLAIAVLLVFIAHRSGNSTPVDSVAAARSRYGVEFREQMVATNGIQLHVVEAGPSDGAVVVLLHGFPEFWWGWKDQIARLAQAGFHVVAPDQRGYNASSKPQDIEAYRPRELEADILGLIDHFGGKVFLAGHDWGGLVAWRIVIEHPEKVRRFVAFNMAHPRAFEDLKRLPEQPERTSWYQTFFQLPLLPEFFTRIGNWYILANSLRNSSRRGSFPPEDLDHYRYAWDRDGAMHTMVHWYRAIYRFPDTIEGNQTVTVPTRIVWGTKDLFVPYPLASLSAGYCKQAEVVELGNAGHWLLHEDPELTSRELIDFFAAGR